MRALSSHEITMVAGADLTTDISALGSVFYVGNFIGENAGNLLAGILTMGLTMTGKDANAAKAGINAISVACRIFLPLAIGYKITNQHPEVSATLANKFEHYFG